MLIFLCFQDEQREYTRIKDETVMVKNTTDESKLREMWQQVNADEKLREKESAQHAQWLKEREERKLEMERAWRPATHLFQTSSPNLSPAPSPRPISKSTASDDMDIEEIKTGTSPLLTSLLKSPSTAVASTSQPTTAPTVVLSSRNDAPTITNLLTGAATTSMSDSITNTTQSYPLMHKSLTGPPRENSQSNVVPAQSPSQEAPTLSMLLENKSKEATTPKMPLKTQPTPLETHPTDTADQSSIGSPLKDEEQQLMEVFNTLIPDNIDELADILVDNDTIILNPELLAEAEESILESVESMMAAQAGIDMETDDFEQAISNPATAAAESISTAELVEQLTSTSGFPIGPTPTVKGDAKPEAPETSNPDEVEIILESLIDPKETTMDGTETKSPTVVEILSKDDDQSDLSNDAPLSELLKDKTPVEPIEILADEDDEPAEAASPKERADVFESDSNDDKCLEIIKREIHELTGLKGNESSDNSNEASSDKQNGSDAAAVAEDDEDSKLITLIPVKDDSNDGEAEQPSANEADNTPTGEDAEDEVEIIATTVEIKSGDEAEEMSEAETVLFEDAQEELADDAPPLAPSNTIDISITIDDTDDDSVIEMTTDDKHSRTKRDYTRRKGDATEKRSAVTDDQTANTSSLLDESSTTANTGKTSTTASATATKSTLSSRMRLKDRDRSESPYVDDTTDAESTHSRSKRRYSSTPVLDSMPNSPASSSDDNREYRAWKKSIQLVLNRLSMHKYANYFLRPTSDELSYREAVLRPMDLHTLKRGVDSGVVRTTVEFQRDVMLMCSNACMFHATDDTVHQAMIRQMESDSLQTIDTIMEAWRKEYEKPAPTATAPSTPLGVASIAAPAAAATTTPTPTAASTKPVRGRKSHRVSAGHHPSN